MQTRWYTPVDMYERKLHVDFAVWSQEVDMISCGRVMGKKKHKPMY